MPIKSVLNIATDKDQNSFLRQVKPLVADPSVHRLAQGMQEKMIQDAVRAVSQTAVFQTYYDLAKIAESHFLTRKSPMFEDHVFLKQQFLTTFYHTPMDDNDSSDLQDEKRRLERSLNSLRWGSSRGYEERERITRQIAKIDEKIKAEEKAVKNIDISTLKTQAFNSKTDETITHVAFGNSAYAHLSEIGKEKWKIMYDKNVKSTFNQAITPEWVTNMIQKMYNQCEAPAEKCSIAVLSLFADQQRNALFPQNTIIESVKRVPLDRDNYNLMGLRDYAGNIVEKAETPSALQYDAKRKRSLLTSAEKVLDIIRNNINRSDFEWESRWDENNKRNWNAVGCVADNYEVSGDTSLVQEYQEEAEKKIQDMGLVNDLRVNFHHGDKNWYMFEICIK